MNKMKNKSFNKILAINKVIFPYLIWLIYFFIVVVSYMLFTLDVVVYPGFSYKYLSFSENLGFFFIVVASSLAWIVSLVMFRETKQSKVVAALVVNKNV